MTPTTWLVIALLGWVSIAVVLAMALGRRGFDSFSWFLIGMVLGPIALVIAWSCLRRDEELDPTVIRTGALGPREGTSMLVGVDGSAECMAAIGAVLRTFDGSLGRVAFATVLHFDGPKSDEDAARARLDSIGRTFRSLRPTLLLVRGHPATALAREATAGAFDVIAIGATGHGRAHVFGSTAKELIQHSPVPVFVAGQRVGQQPEAVSA
jgi:nucleotide-binding universal stress UspA family protein